MALERGSSALMPPGPGGAGATAGGMPGLNYNPSPGAGAVSAMPAPNVRSMPSFGGMSGGPPGGMQTGQMPGMGGAAGPMPPSMGGGMTPGLMNPNLRSMQGPAVNVGAMYGGLPALLAQIRGMYGQRPPIGGLPQPQPPAGIAGSPPGGSAADPNLMNYLGQ
jgi:hypothetical protein